MLENSDVRLDASPDDVRETVPRIAFARNTSRTDRVRAEDIGLLRESREVNEASRQLRVSVRVVGLVSVLGLIGSLVTIADLVLDIVQVPGFENLVAFGMGCGVDTPCAVYFGLPAPAFFALVISVVSGLTSILGFLWVRLVSVRVFERVRRRVVEHAELVEARRFIYLGSGEARFTIGNAGLELRVGDRRAQFPWSEFDATALLYGEDADLFEVDNPSALGGADLARLFVRPQTDPVITTFLERARSWAETHERIDLPVRIDRLPDPDGRPAAALTAPEWTETLRVSRRYFAGPANQHLNWSEFVSACVFMIVQLDRNIGVAVKID